MFSPVWTEQAEETYGELKSKAEASLRARQSVGSVGTVLNMSTSRWPFAPESGEMRCPARPHGASLTLPRDLVFP